MAQIDKAPQVEDATGAQIHERALPTHRLRFLVEKAPLGRSIV